MESINSALDKTGDFGSESSACMYLVLGEAIIEIRVYHDGHDHDGKFRNAPTHNDCCKWEVILE